MQMVENEDEGLEKVGNLSDVKLREVEYTSLADASCRIK